MNTSTSDSRDSASSQTYVCQPAPSVRKSDKTTSTPRRKMRSNRLGNTQESLCGALFSGSLLRPTMRSRSQRFVSSDAGSFRSQRTLSTSLAAKQAVWLYNKRPSARRGPGIVSVDRNVRSKCRCSCVLQFTS